MWEGDITAGIITAAGILGMIASLPCFIQIFPSLLGALVRWRGSLSLYTSASLGRSRDRVTAGLVIPFILVAARFNLMDFDIRCSPAATIGIYAGFFACYVAVRAVTGLIKSGAISRDKWNLARSVERNFFIITVSVMLFTLVVTYPFGICEAALIKVFRWEIIFFYCMFLYRKSKILYHLRDKYGDILYLCTLEFLPLGFIVVSALFW